MFCPWHKARRFTKTHHCSENTTSIVKHGGGSIVLKVILGFLVIPRTNALTFWMTSEQNCGDAIFFFFNHCLLMDLMVLQWMVKVWDF